MIEKAKKAKLARLCKDKDKTVSASWKKKSILNITLDQDELEELTFLDKEEMLALYRDKYTSYGDERYESLQYHVLTKINIQNLGKN